MINKSIFFLLLITSFTLTGFGKPVKVIFTYSFEDVTLIYNDKVYSESPKKLLIDFELGGQIIAFKSGYESHLIKISNAEIFSSYAVKLKPLENKCLGSALQLELKKVSYINYVTNYTPEEVTEIINAKLNQCKILTYSQNSVFKDVKVNTKKFSIGAEILKSTSKNGSYTSPYYLFSHQKIKWYLLDNTSHQVTLEFITEGAYLAYFKAIKGVVTSDRLKEITILSLEEATQKFVNSPEFNDFMSKAVANK